MWKDLVYCSVFRLSLLSRQRALWRFCILKEVFIHILKWHFTSISYTFLILSSCQSIHRCSSHMPISYHMTRKWMNSVSLKSMFQPVLVDIIFCYDIVFFSNKCYCFKKVNQNLITLTPNNQYIVQSTLSVVLLKQILSFFYDKQGVIMSLFYSMCKVRMSLS